MTRSTMPPPPPSETPPTATPIPNRCTVCPALVDGKHCEICHRAARAAGRDTFSEIVEAVARLAEAIGYEETAREMRELAQGFGDPGGEVREVNLGGVPG